MQEKKRRFLVIMFVTAIALSGLSSLVPRPQETLIEAFNQSASNTDTADSDRSAQE